MTIAMTTTMAMTMLMAMITVQLRKWWDGIRMILFNVYRLYLFFLSCVLDESVDLYVIGDKPAVLHCSRLSLSVASRQKYIVEEDA